MYSWTYAGWMFEWGKQLFRDGYLNEALEYLKESNKGSTNRYTLYYMGLSFFNLKQYEEAYQAFTECYSILQKKETNENIIVLRRLYQVSMEMNNYKKAEENIDKAFEIGPRALSTIDFQILKAELNTYKCYIQQKKEEEKNIIFEKMYEKGKELEEKKRYSEAIEMYVKYNEDSEKAEAHQALARCYKETQDFEKAFDHIEAYIEMNREKHRFDYENTLPSLLLKGDILLSMGRIKEMMDTLKEAEEKSIEYSISQTQEYIKSKYATVKLLYEIHKKEIEKSPKEESRTLYEIQEERKFAVKVLDNLSDYEPIESWWYIVSTKWYFAWKKYMKFFSEKRIADNKEEFEPDLSHYPGPILNEEIILFENSLTDPDPAKEYLKYPIKDGLKGHIDFIIVPGVLWKVWKSAYGGFSLPRKAFFFEDPRKFRVELVFQRICLLFFPKCSWIPFTSNTTYIEKSSTVKELRMFIMRVINKFIGKSSITIKDIRLVLWKLMDNDLESVDRSIQREKAKNKTQYCIDAIKLKDDTIIEDASISTDNIIISEII